MPRSQELPSPYSFVKHSGNEAAERDQKMDKELIVKVGDG